MGVVRDEIPPPNVTTRHDNVCLSYFPRPVERVIKLVFGCVCLGLSDDSAIDVVLISEIYDPFSILDSHHAVRTIVSVFGDLTVLIGDLPEPVTAVVGIAYGVAVVVGYLADAIAAAVGKLQPAAA